MSEKRYILKKRETRAAPVPPIPGPYKVVEFDPERLLIVRPWDLLVTPAKAHTFGSAWGAHIAEVRMLPGGTATPEQARANAEQLALAPTALALLQEAQEWLRHIKTETNGIGYLETSVNTVALDDLIDRIDVVTDERNTGDAYRREV